MECVPFQFVGVMGDGQGKRICGVHRRGGRVDKGALKLFNLKRKRKYLVDAEECRVRDETVNQDAKT